MRKFFVINVPEVLSEQRLYPSLHQIALLSSLQYAYELLIFPAGLFALASLGYLAIWISRQLADNFKFSRW